MSLPKARSKSRAGLLASSHNGRHLNLLVEQLVPAHLVQAEKGHPIRVLSLGCSAGEEPYSIAIALRERYGDLAEPLVRITAGDVDEAALERARTFAVVSELIRSVVDLAETPDTQAPALADLLGLARPYPCADAQRLLDDLKHLWIALAMDDFGSGDSSLAYLEGLPFDTLKIGASSAGFRTTPSAPPSSPPSPRSATARGSMPWPRVSRRRHSAGFYSGSTAAVLEAICSVHPCRQRRSFGSCLGSAYPEHPGQFMNRSRWAYHCENHAGSGRRADRGGRPSTGGR